MTKGLFIIANEFDNMSLNSLPFFSVIIPTFNRKELLIRAINSLLLQEGQSWEAIIVDDGSDDSTHSFIQFYLKSDFRIKYVRQENRGAALAKNYGIEKAKGSFVTFLDSDDEYDLGHLESRKKILVENPEVKFLFGGLKIIGSPFVPDRFDTDKKIHLDDCVIGGTFFIERSLLLSLNGFKNILIGEDAELFERICRLDILKLKTEVPSYIYRKDVKDSVTNNFIK